MTSKRELIDQLREIYVKIELAQKTLLEYIQYEIDDADNYIYINKTELYQLIKDVQEELDYQHNNFIRKGGR